MKKFKLVSAILFSVFLLFSSCNNDSDTITKAEMKPTSVSAKNAANPYNQLGILHNQFMKQRKEAPLDSQDEILNSAFQYFEQSGYDTGIIDHTQMAQAVNQAVSGGFTIDKINQLAVVYNFSDAYKAQLYKLVNFFNATDYTSTTQMVDRMNELEAEYLNTQLPDNEKAQLLSVIAIASESLAYWISLYPNDIPNTTGKASWFNRIFGGAICDVFGAVIGGGIGGPIGAGIGAAAASAYVQKFIEY